MKFKRMERATDLVLLNLMFLLCSIPVVTLGASATAMHYALRRWREEQGDVVQDFWKSLKLNFKQATTLWMVFLAVAAITVLNFRIVSTWTGYAYDVFTVLLIGVAYMLLTWATVVFPFLARFDDSTGRIAKNALLLALSHPVRSLCALSLNLFPLVFAILLPNLFLLVSALWLLVLCGVSGLLTQSLFAPVFDRIQK